MILKKIRLFKEIIFNKRQRMVMWELTSACNCKCEMCHLWRKKPFFINLEKAKRLVDFMYKNKVAFIQITGGEPTLYKDLIPLVKHITSKGIILNLATNGTKITKDYAKKLKKAGLKYINISFDYHKPGIQNKIRRHKKHFEKSVKAVKILKKHGLKVYASCMINRYNCNEIKELVCFVNSLGIPLSACFPYSEFGEKKSASRIKKKDLVEVFKELIEIKSKGYKIYNSTTFLKECIQYAEKGKTDYPCLAGSSVYALKGNGDFYACWLRNKIFNIESGWKEQELNCNKCHLTCFRETSILSKQYKEDKIGFLKSILNMI